MIETQIRAAGDQDVAAITSFISGLSLRTRYLRFFTGAGPSSAVIRLLAGGTGADVLVATCDGVVVGHAIAVEVEDPGSPVLADVGVVVADAWQGRGVGSALLRTLVTRAGGRGAAGITMSVLPENRRVLANLAPSAGDKSPVTGRSVSWRCAPTRHIGAAALGRSGARSRRRQGAQRRSITSSQDAQWRSITSSAGCAVAAATAISYHKLQARQPKQDDQ